MSENSADNLDHASEVEQGFRDRAIAAARRLPPVPKDFDGKTCVECSEDIPEQRLALGKFTCVHCQAVIERTTRWR